VVERAGGVVILASGLRELADAERDGETGVAEAGGSGSSGCC
jgi:hypothetical protein